MFIEGSMSHRGNVDSLSVFIQCTWPMAFTCFDGFKGCFYYEHKSVVITQPIDKTK